MIIIKIIIDNNCNYCIKYLNNLLILIYKYYIVFIKYLNNYEESDWCQIRLVSNPTGAKSVGAKSVGEKSDWRQIRLAPNPIGARSDWRQIRWWKIPLARSPMARNPLAPNPIGAKYFGEK